MAPVDLLAQSDRSIEKDEEEKEKKDEEEETAPRWQDEFWKS